MSVDVQVSDSLDVLADPEWERLAAARTVFHETAWFRAAPPPGRVRLLLARRAGRPLAALPLFLAREEGHYYHSPRQLFCGFRERALLGALGLSCQELERAAAADWLPAAVAVSPYGYRGGLIADPHERDLPAAAAALAQAADDLCRDERVRLAAHLFLYEDDDRAWIDALSERGAWCAVSGADCRLEQRWTTLDAYFRALGRRGRRQRAAHRRALGSGEVAWRATELNGNGAGAELSAPALALFAATARAHGDADPPLELYRRALDDWPGRRLLLSGHARDGTMRSALLVFAKGSTLYPKLFGAAGVRDDYFYLTYSGLVARGIDEHATAIDYGGGNHLSKLLRGARLRWHVAALRVYDRRLQARLGAFWPVYGRAKTAYFRTLASRYGVGEAAPREFAPTLGGGPSR